MKRIIRNRRLTPEEVAKDDLVRKQIVKDFPPKLIPADRKQCQAEKPNGHSFMTLGGVPGHVRCKNKPVVIAKEIKPGADGQRGSMSLCEDCKKVFLSKFGEGFAKLTPIK